MSKQGVLGGKKGKYGSYFYVLFCIALISMISCFFILIRLPKVDNIPYIKTLDNEAYSVKDFSAANERVCNVTDYALSARDKEGEKMFSAEVSLGEGDAFLVSGIVVNESDEPVNIVVDLFSENYHQGYNRFSVLAGKGETSLKGRLPFYRGQHPEKCSLRIYANGKGAFSVHDFNVTRVSEVIDGNRVVRNSLIAFWILFALSGFCLLYCMVRSVVFFRKSDRDSRAVILFFRNHAKTAGSFLIVILTVSAALLYFYRKIDTRYPLSYTGGDEMGVYYFVKCIKEQGLSFVNPMVGGLSGGDMFDYPFSDGLSFLIVKIISFFVADTYTITNLFYFFNYYLIAAVCFVVCKRLGFRNSISIVLSVLYCFSPYIQSRYPHMWLVPYYMLPVAWLISIEIIEGKIVNTNETVGDGKVFWRYFVLAFLCAFTGLYYAFFSCALFSVAFIIRAVHSREKRTRIELYPIAFICSTVLGVLVNIVPNLVFWMINGTNPSSQISLRAAGDAEIYGLKLVQMLLPRDGHRIGIFAAVREFYNKNYPMVNENATAALGLIASVGLIFCIVTLFTKSRFCKSYAYLSVSVFLIATIGGMSSLISVFFRIPIRCYNRMSIILMFLSLLTIGSYLSRWLEGKHMIIEAGLCLLLTGIGLYDQTITIPSNISTAFIEKREMMRQIQGILEQGDMVFVLPYTDWVSGTGYRQHMGYIETDGIRWSYGAMEGREEAVWQSMVSGYPTEEMVQVLQDAGYDGIYVDQDLYVMAYDDTQLEEKKREITEITGKEPLVCGDGSALFWDIR